METQFMFREKITDVDINGLHEFLKLEKSIDIDFPLKAEVTVQFDLQPEYRSWGIDSISFLPRRVLYTLRWTCDGEFLSDDQRAAILATGATEMNDNTFEGTIEIDSMEKLNGKEWTFNDEIDFSSDGGFQLVTVEIDFSKMTITFLT